MSVIFRSAGLEADSAGLMARPVNDKPARPVEFLKNARRFILKVLELIKDCFRAVKLEKNSIFQAFCAVFICYNVVGRFIAGARLLGCFMTFSERTYFDESAFFSASVNSK